MVAIPIGLLCGDGDKLIWRQCFRVNHAFDEKARSIGCKIVHSTVGRGILHYEDNNGVSFKMVGKFLGRITLLICLLSASTLCFSVGGGSSSNSKKVKELPSDIVTMVESRNFDIAIESLVDFIKQEKNNANAWNLLGYSQRNIGLYDDSLKSYKKALKIDKKHLGAREYLGELYLTLDKPKKAQLQLKKLRKYCGSDCEQYKDLEIAIQSYESGS